MAGSVNKVILIGNLGKDPEVRHLENGSTVASFPIVEYWVDIGQHDDLKRAQNDMQEMRWAS